MNTPLSSDEPSDQTPALWTLPLELCDLAGLAAWENGPVTPPVSGSIPPASYTSAD